MEEWNFWQEKFSTNQKNIIMAKEKLFSPEDFDKPADKSWWQKYRVLILGLSGALIIIAIILCCIFLKDVDKEEVSAQQELTESPQEENSLEYNHTSNSEILATQGEERAESELEDTKTEIVEITLSPEDKRKEEDAQTKAIDLNVSNNVETEALNVIHGDYGNGEIRKNKLGDKYQPIQNRVNELKRQGAF